MIMTKQDIKHKEWNDNLNRLNRVAGEKQDIKEKRIQELEKRIEELEKRQCNHHCTHINYPVQAPPIQQLWKCQICGLNQCRGHCTSYE